MSVSTPQCRFKRFNLERAIDTNDLESVRALMTRNPELHRSAGVCEQRAADWVDAFLLGRSAPTDRVPGVVVLRDAGGMSQDHRSQADWLAEAGFLALNLYHRGGLSVSTPSCVRPSTRKLPILEHIGRLAGVSQEQWTEAAPRLLFYDERLHGIYPPNAT